MNRLRFERCDVVENSDSGKLCHCSGGCEKKLKSMYGLRHFTVTDIP